MVTFINCTECRVLYWQYSELRRVVLECWCVPAQAQLYISTGGGVSLDPLSQDDTPNKKPSSPAAVTSEASPDLDLDQQGDEVNTHHAGVRGGRVVRTRSAGGARRGAARPGGAAASPGTVWCERAAGDGDAVPRARGSAGGSSYRRAGGSAPAPGRRTRAADRGGPGFIPRGTSLHGRAGGLPDVRGDVSVRRLPGLLHPRAHRRRLLLGRLQPGLLHAGGAGLRDAFLRRHACLRLHHHCARILLARVHTLQHSTAHHTLPGYHCVREADRAGVVRGAGRHARRGCRLRTNCRLGADHVGSEHARRVRGRHLQRRVPAVLRHAGVVRGDVHQRRGRTEPVRR